MGGVALYSFGGGSRRNKKVRTQSNDIVTYVQAKFCIKNFLLSQISSYFPIKRTGRFLIAGLASGYFVALQACFI
jgi:hypothetical protein